MLVNAATSDALDVIARRASDVYKAYTPGARPTFGDVETAGPAAQAVTDPLSVAPPADAYFITIDGRGRTAYTQNGCFEVRDGTLTGSNGRPIIGFPSADSPPSELHVDPVDFALGRATDIRLDADGSLSYARSSMDPRTGTRENERVVVGQLALARFPPATKLSPIDADHASAPHDVVPHTGRAGDGSFSRLAPMHRESSRIDIDASLDRLNEAYTAFDALIAAHRAQGTLGKTAMDLLK